MTVFKIIFLILLVIPFIAFVVYLLGRMIDDFDSSVKRKQRSQRELSAVNEMKIDKQTFSNGEAHREGRQSFYSFERASTMDTNSESENTQDDGKSSDLHRKPGKRRRRKQRKAASKGRRSGEQRI